MSGEGSNRKRTSLPGSALFPSAARLVSDADVEGNLLVFSCVSAVLKFLATAQSWTVVDSDHLSRTCRADTACSGMLWPSNPRTSLTGVGCEHTFLFQVSLLWIASLSSRVVLLHFYTFITKLIIISFSCLNFGVFSASWLDLYTSLISNWFVMPSLSQINWYIHQVISLLTHLFVLFLACQLLIS